MHQKWACFTGNHNHVHGTPATPGAKPRVADDFYEAVNADWLASTTIPTDRPSMSSFGELDVAIEKLEQPLFEDFLKHPEKAPTELAEFLKYFALTRAYNDRDAAGFSPLLNDLSWLQTMSSPADLWQQLVTLLEKNITLPFQFDVDPDMKQADRYALWFNPPALLLRDRSFYEESLERGKALKETIHSVTKKIAAQVNYSETAMADLVDDALAFDEWLYPFTKTAEESADYPAYYHPYSLQDVQSVFGTYDLANLTPLVGSLPEQIIVSHPPFLDEALPKILAPETFKQVKAWIIVRFLLNRLSLLDEHARQLNGAFNQVLTGTKEVSPRDKAAFRQATNFFGQVIGQYYGRQYFGTKAKADVEAMVQNMIAIYRTRLASNTWLAVETKEQAIKKLDSIAVHVGYPEKLPSYYADLVVPENSSFYETHQLFTRILVKASFAKTGKAVERDLWEMSADTVNAYYNPFGNEIVFPAAILQSPFYSLEQSSSANMGGVGAIIAHEISHAFDNNGAQFDEKGNLKDWWTAADYAAFKERSQAMIAQFDQLPFGEGKVNGTLTVSENIADAGGLSCALEAAQKEADFSSVAFFENWARAWRNLSSPELTNLLLTMDVHAPAKLRANVQPQNLAAFYEAFGITEADAMYLEPDKRVHIW